MGKCVASGLPYVVEVSITEKSGAACNHWPQSLPSSLLDIGDAGVSFGIVIAGVPEFGRCFFSRCHHYV